ncbi:V-type proton ATPase 116 kDa subunit a1-like isoform X2 [Cylas formicarius]|nr:V-type proton ATPase 116 kDa subunit a1-like isoform X2 [Cylas formicarius]
MGSLFRSEEMALAQLFIQPEAAYFVVSELGETGCVQFRDLNEETNVFQRQFVSEVRRCEEMEKKLRYIEQEVKRDDVFVPDMRELPMAPNPRQIIDLEAHLEKTEADIRELSENTATLKSDLNELVQMKHVLEKAQNFFNQREEVTHDPNWSPDDVEGDTPLGYVAGVINQEKFYPFEKILWRIGRGNIFVKYDEINEALDDPKTGTRNKKVAFMAFFQGSNLQSRVKKICAGFHVSLCECPHSASSRRERLISIATDVADIETVLNQTMDHRRRLLHTVAKELANWTVMVCKMKAIYHTLNLLSVDVSKKFLIGEAWVPTADMHLVENALTQGSISCGSTVPSFLNIIETKETPPTFNRTNKFTQGFQNLISSYAFASYRELNPALYTIVTFPFLFAVMFGDLGHGAIMFLSGLSLVLLEKKLERRKDMGEIFNIFFAGRYIILLMGLFSMYTGFIYNDIFSKSMNIFGTKWKVMYDTLPENSSDSYYQFVPRINFEGDPYWAGVDPAWQSAENKIIFLNSFKMKLSIIIGVVHMVFGIVLSTVNFIHLKKYSALLLDFLPKILFFFLMFVYLVVMVFMKYTMYSGLYDGANDTDTSPGVDTVHGSSCAPSVLIYFIDMMLFKQPDATDPCEKYMYPSQEIIQKMFIFVALICIPFLLLGTPLYEMQKRKRSHRAQGVNHVENGYRNGQVNQAMEMDSRESMKQALTPTSTAEEGHEEEEEPMSEIFVHSAIHTIEYTLSTVSHTASYLRLWALSLAHAQLSEVLWTMVFRKGLTMSGYVGVAAVFIIFAVWAFFTVAILVLMEGLSAFLHTLRLHWVEFMTKFYEGAGYDFRPFSFKTVLEPED